MGDYAYNLDDDNGQKGNIFMQKMEQLFSSWPSMVIHHGCYVFQLYYLGDSRKSWRGKRLCLLQSKIPSSDVQSYQQSLLFLWYWSNPFRWYQFRPNCYDGQLLELTSGVYRSRSYYCKSTSKSWVETLDYNILPPAILHYLNIWTTKNRTDIFAVIHRDWGTVWKVRCRHILQWSYPCVSKVHSIVMVLDSLLTSGCSRCIRTRLWVITVPTNRCQMWKPLFRFLKEF